MRTRMFKRVLALVLLTLLLPLAAFIFDLWPEYARSLVEEFAERPEIEIDRGRSSSSPAVYLPPEEGMTHPIIVWWTPFTPYQRIVRPCSRGECLFTQSRTELDNPNASVFLFYGTEINWTDLPLPRARHHLWAILHEESPKNNWVLAQNDGISLFNFTSTFSRNSSYPLTSQYLHTVRVLSEPQRVATADKSKDGLGLVIYLQSDCNPPSDRDSYVEELMKYVKVDSYGRCLHNKELPESLLDPLTFADEDVLDIVAQYKFAIAFENAVCHDYITEKYWRPLYSGTVPIVRGSPTVSEWAPDLNRSIIVAEDFAGPKELAEFVQYLDENNEEYDKYLEWKRSGVSNQMLLDHMSSREWSVDNNGKNDSAINFIDGFECYICDQLHLRRTQAHSGAPLPSVVADSSHFDCPVPEPAIKQTNLTLQEQMQHMSKSAREELFYWRYVERCSRIKAKALVDSIALGGTQEDVTEALAEACRHTANFE